ncbi:rab GTPase-activating protein 1 [Ixodes scapularis]
MQDQLPELHAHFLDLGVEAHMFGSQWFLTLFTAKFPLHVVFFILDLFLLDGMDTLFQVAVALLTLSCRDLLALDFEGVLKHFRVAVPKKYRSEEAAKTLLHTAVAIKVKKLKRYEREYQVHKEQERQMEDPVQVLQPHPRPQDENTGPGLCASLLFAIFARDSHVCYHAGKKLDTRGVPEGVVCNRADVRRAGVRVRSRAE